MRSDHTLSDPHHHSNSFLKLQILRHLLETHSETFCYVTSVGALGLPKTEIERKKNREMSRTVLLSLCLSSRETTQRKERSSELAPGTDSSQLLLQAEDKASLPARVGFLKKAGL